MASRRRMTVALPAPEAPAVGLPGARAVDPSADREALAGLLLAAYRGTVDDEGETGDDALATVDALFAGDFGAFDADASEVVVRAGRMVAATLVTDWDGGPFVAFSMTDPAVQRQGLARAGLRRAMARLASRGASRLDLVVTPANDRAIALYEQLGFVDRE